MNGSPRSKWLPPGLELEPDESISCVELFMEWMAYIYLSRFDVFLVVAITAAMYDALWTPCVWLLPIDADMESLVIGIAVDCFCILLVLVGWAMWGSYGRRFQVALDLLTSFPWEAIGLWTQEARPLFGIRMLVKLHRFFRLRSLLTRRYREDVRANWNQVSIFLWLVYIFIFTHWSALLWAWLGTRRQLTAYPGSWIGIYVSRRRVIVRGERVVSADQFAADVPTLYLRSIYWATVTMTTVGYGDIVPSTGGDSDSSELTVSMFVMLCGLILYLLLSAEMTTLISNSSRLGEEFRTTVEQTSRYLAYRNVPVGLTKRVRAYFSLRWLRTRGFSENAVINDLPRSLALDVRVELYKGLLDRVPLFKGVEEIFIRQLVKFVSLDFYMPDEYIIRKHDVGKEMFFIQRGVCHVLADDENAPLFTLKTGSFFGEIALVLSERRSASVAAGTACDILVLHRRDLFLTLNDYPAVATLLHGFARQRLKERQSAEEEKSKADALREAMAEKKSKDDLARGIGEHRFSITSCLPRRCSDLVERGAQSAAVAFRRNSASVSTESEKRGRAVDEGGQGHEETKRQSSKGSACEESARSRKLPACNRVSHGEIERTSTIAGVSPGMRSFRKSGRVAPHEGRASAVDSDAQVSLTYHLERNACTNTLAGEEFGDNAVDAGAVTSASEGSRRRVSCTDVSQGVEMPTVLSAQHSPTLDASISGVHSERTRRNSLLRGMHSKISRRPSRERMDEMYPTQAGGYRPFRRPSRERLGEQQPGSACCSSATSSAPRTMQRRASSPEIGRLGSMELKDAISASVMEGALSLEALMSGGGVATSAAPTVSACGSNADQAAPLHSRSRPLADPGDATGIPSYISEWMSADVNAITLCGTSHRTRGLLGLPGDEDVDNGFVGGELNLEAAAGIFAVEPGKVLITATDGERSVAVGGEPKVEASKRLQRTRRTSEMHVADADASAHRDTSNVVPTMAAQDEAPSTIREAARLDTELVAEPSPPPSPPSNQTGTGCVDGSNAGANQPPRRKVARSASLLTPNATRGCPVPGHGRGCGSSVAMPTISARKASFNSGGVSVFGTTEGSARNSSASGRSSRSNSLQPKADSESMPHQRRRSSAFMMKRHSGQSDRASSGADDSVDKGGMDAATFINTRPWVRQRAEGQSDADMHGIDEAGTRFWDPNGWAATSLDIFGAALNYVNMMLFPVICFIFKQLPSNLLFGMLVFDVWMAVDMAMHLAGKRPFYDHASKVLVTDRKQIVKHYLRTRFPIDLLSSLPYELVPLAIGVTVSPFWRLRCVVRFYRVFRVLRRLEDSFEFQGYVAITRLFLFLFVLVHMTACLWLWLGTMEGGWAYQDPAHTQSALQCANDPFGGCWVLYHKSLYWVMATVITVGYGDIIPTSNEEIAFAAVVCFSFHACFSYILGLITNYVFALNRTAALFRDKLAQLNAFMEYRQLSESVRARISELYSGRLWQSTGGLDEQTILSALPASIRRNVSLLMYAELLLKVPLFADAEFGFIQSLADRLRPHVYPPLELVVLIGEIGREMFFCARGECEVLGADNTRVFVITDGMFFGEVAVLFSVKCTATVRTVTYCDLVSLSKEALADAMKDYPKASQIIAAKAKARMTQLGIESTLLREVVNDNVRAEAPSDGESFQSNAPSEVEGHSNAVETPRQQRGRSHNRFSFREIVQR